MQPAVLKLLAMAGAIFCGIRLTILQGLVGAGPDITAALVPLTPIFTTVLAVSMGREKLRVSTGAGQQQVGGMIVCTLSACLMGVLRGPLLFGNPNGGADAVAPPSNVPAGVAFMLLECLLAAWVQIVNRRTLIEHGYPTVSTTAGVACFACAFLFPAACVMAPPGSWRLTPVLAGAVLYSGFFGTAMNNILLARANKRLGSTVANLYMPLQQVMTALLDWATLGDAVYTANLVCGTFVTLGLAAAVVGKARGDAEAAAAMRGASAEEREGEHERLLYVQLTEPRGSDGSGGGELCGADKEAETATESFGGMGGLQASKSYTEIPESPTNGPLDRI